MTTVIKNIWTNSLIGSEKFPQLQLQQLSGRKYFFNNLGQKQHFKKAWKYVTGHIFTNISNCFVWFKRVKNILPQWKIQQTFGQHNPYTCYRTYHFSFTLVKPRWPSACTHAQPDHIYLGWYNFCAELLSRGDSSKYLGWRIASVKASPFHHMC